MDLAIVVVSYNVRDLLDACLHSVYQSLEASPELCATVWVVDNASDDSSADMVVQQYPQAILIASQDNLGFPGGNNLALRSLGFGTGDRRNGNGEESPYSQIRVGTGAAYQARPTMPANSPTPPRYVLLLNPDTVVLDDALARMVSFLDATPNAGACGARLSYPDGRFQHGAFRFPGLAQVALDFFPPPGRLNQPLLDSQLNGRYPKRLYENTQPFPVDFVLGASLMVRTTAIRQVGLLDEGYFMYCEEMDWQRRLRSAGWGVYCVPSAHIIHHGGASTGQVHSAMMVALWRSRLRYFQRFHGAGFNWLMAKLVSQGAQAEARRAVKLALPDGEERLAAYQAITSLAEQHAAGI